MKKKFTYKIIVCLLSLPFLLFPGNKEDSLRKVISTSKSDTTVCNALYNLGRRLRKKNIDTATFYIQRSLDLATKIGFKKGRSKGLNALATLRSMKGDFFEAKIACRESMLFHKQEKMKQALGDCYNVFASVFFRTDEMDSCIHYYMLSLKLVEEVGDSIGISYTLNNLSKVFKEQKNYAKSLEYMKLVMNISRRSKDSSSLASDYDGLGNLYLDMGEMEKAKAAYLRSMDMAQSIHDTLILSYVYTNYGILCYKQKDFDQSLKYAKLSLIMSRAIKDEEGIMIALEDIGDTYLKLNNLDSSSFYLKKTIDRAVAQDRKNTLMSAYKNLGEIEFRKGNLKEAYNYQTMYVAIKDSVESLNNRETLKNLTVKFDVDRKEKEILLLNKDQQIQNEELKKRRNIIYVFILFALLLVALAVVTIKSNIRRKKDNVKLTNLNNEISAQKKEVEHQKEIVDEKQKEILDSIHYANRIQKALLANQEMLDRNIPDNFVLFKPKDIVSGDFYWATEHDNKFYLGVCDSTGHGVPGAFMCLLNIGFLSEAIKEKNISKPNEILNYVRERLITSISGDGQKDGFDGILICIDKKTKKITYSAAHNPPVIISQNQIIELSCDKMPVGQGEKTDSFTLNTIEGKKGEILYLYTDGYPDQFGGPKGKKFMYKNLNQFLIATSALSLSEQKEALNKKFEEWRGGLEQVDDVCVIGIRL